MLTFHNLLKCPAIAELKADAASIAELERWPWYEHWIDDSTIFHRAVRAAALALHAPEDSIRDVALTGLLDAYFTSKRRRAKREANA